MATMKAVQIPERNGALQLVEREIPEAGRGQVRIRVEACGVCHGEVVAIEGHFPHMQYPRIPGHEVIGVIDQIGEGVLGFEVGERVGVGWNGGHDQVTGLTMDGGYAEYMVAFADGLARIPDGLSAVDAAPLMCAGVTTFGALRNSAARAGIWWLSKELADWDTLQSSTRARQGSIRSPYRVDAIKRLWR